MFWELKWFKVTQKPKRLDTTTPYVALEQHSLSYSSQLALLKT